MPVDFVRQKQAFIAQAQQLVRAHPPVAAAYTMDERTIAEAGDWFDDPLFSPHADRARRAAEFIRHLLGKTDGQRFVDFFASTALSAPIPPGETRWQMEALSAIAAKAQNATVFDAQGAAIEFAVFLQRASADLYAYSATPYSPLHSRARVLLQRLWSVERGSDTTLAGDLRLWLGDFDAFMKGGVFDRHLDVATLDAFGRLPDPALLEGLALEREQGDPSALPQTAFAIDSAWLLFGHGNRFAALAAPVAGLMLLVDAGTPEGNLPWEASFDEFLPKERRLPSQGEYLAWVEPQQRFLEIASDLTSIGLMTAQAQFPVLLRDRPQTAIVLRFHDYAHWHHATQSLGTFGLLCERPGFDRDLLAGRVTDAYLRLAEAGYLSLDPQYFVHRRTAEVKLAQLRSIFRMREFPYRFFVDAITRTITEKFGYYDERSEIREVVIKRVLRFLGENRLPPNVVVGDLPKGGARRKNAATDAGKTPPPASFSGVEHADGGEPPPADEAAREAEALLATTPADAAQGDGAPDTAASAGSTGHAVAPSIPVSPATTAGH